MLSAVSRAKCALKRPMSLVTQPSRSVVDWNLLARAGPQSNFSPLSAKVETAELQQLQKAYNESMNVINIAPGTVAEPDFAAWRKRILVSQWVDHYENAYKSRPVPTYAATVTQKMNQMNEESEKDSDFFRASTPAEEIFGNIREQVRSLQQQKLDLEDATWHDYFRQHPEAEAHLREKYAKEITHEWE